MIATVDLDDTLLETGKYYGESIQRFVEFMESEYGLDPELVGEHRRKIDHNRQQGLGSHLRGFPEGMLLAYLDLVENPTEEHKDHVYSIGLNTFKSTEQYRQDGFMKGADEMLTHLNDAFSEVHLVTAGDPRVQEPKIEALGLRERFDEIHIVMQAGKESALRQISDSTGVSTGNIVHIGNSATSDIQAAINAGCYGVYISEDMDWISSNEDHENALDHEAVRNYPTADKFVPEIPQISSKLPSISPDQHSL